VRVRTWAVIERECDSAAAVTTAVDRLMESHESCDCFLAQDRFSRSRSLMS